MRRLPVEQEARQRYVENQGIPGSNLLIRGFSFLEPATTMTATTPSDHTPLNPTARRPPFRLILPLLLAVLLVLQIVAATGLGYIEIGPADIVSVMLMQFGGAMPTDLTPSFPFVIMEVRLPRILCAALVGGALAIAGCVFQSLLQNPLADPYTLGISSGAAFGASLAILLLMFGLALPGSLIIPLFAFVGAVLTLFGVFSLSAPSTRLSSNSLILSGIIISAILSAGISLIKFLADEQVNAIIFWLMGSFIGTGWVDVLMLLVLAPRQTAARPEQPFQRFGEVRRVKRNEPHAPMNSLLNPCRNLIADFAVCHVSPPQHDVGRVDDRLGETVLGFVERRSAHFEPFDAPEMIGECPMNAVRVDVADLGVGPLVPVLVPDGNGHESSRLRSCSVPIDDSSLSPSSS